MSLNKYSNQIIVLAIFNASYRHQVCVVRWQKKSNTEKEKHNKNKLNSKNLLLKHKKYKLGIV